MGRLSCAVLVAALVLGVLGMHALSTSCGEGSDHATMAMSSTTSPDGGHSAAARVSQADDAADAPMFGDALSICLAVLLAVGSLLIALALRRTVRGWRVEITWRPAVAPLGRTSRTRPPPSLTALSILRC